MVLIIDPIKEIHNQIQELNIRAKDKLTELRDATNAVKNT